MKIFSHP
jgi:hypothetical protein